MCYAPNVFGKLKPIPSEEIIDRSSKSKSKPKSVSCMAKF